MPSGQFLNGCRKYARGQRDAGTIDSAGLVSPSMYAAKGVKVSAT
jgi:hypothetical protein